MRPKLTDAQISQIVDIVVHHADGEQTVVRDFPVTAKQLPELMLDAGYERCPGCRWYVECGELADEDGNPRKCYNCKPREAEDEDEGQ